MKFMPALFAITLFGSSCSNKIGSIANISQISYSLEYGMCQGYCLTTYTITPNELVKISRSRDTASMPTKSETNSITTEEWNSLIHSIDAKNMDSMQDQYGCPGCADGGIATISISKKGTIKSIRFEEENPPAEISELVTKIKNLIPDVSANNLEPATQGGEFKSASGIVKNYVCSRGCYQYVILMGSRFLYDPKMTEAFQQDGLKIKFSAKLTGSKTEIKKPAPNDIPIRYFDAENITITQIEKSGDS